MTGALAALAGALCWALASVLFARLPAQLSALGLNILKGVIAALLFSLTLALGGHLTTLPPAGPLTLLLLSGLLGIGIGDTAFFACLRRVGPRRALQLEVLAPAMAAVMALLALDETLAMSAWAGIVVTTIGVAWVVSERGGDGEQANRGLAAGIAFGVIAALCQASGAVLARAAFKSVELSPLWSALLRLLAGLAVLFIWRALDRRPLGAELRTLRIPGVGVTLLAATLLGTYCGLWLQQTAFKLTDAGIAQTLLSTSPLFALPLAALLGDRPSLRAIAGALVSVAGIALLFT